MNRLFFLLGLFSGFFVARARAQEAGFDTRGIKQLKELIKTDGQVRSLYGQVQQFADAALAEDPNPIDTIRTEGLLQGDPRKTATWEALRDMHKMYALALAYRVTGRREYLNKVTVYMIAWADSNFSRGDPIDDTNLDPAIEAYDMIKDDLVSAEIKRISGWLRRTAEAEINARYNLPQRATSHNNWHSHRLKVVGEIAFAIGDKKLEEYAINGIKQQIGTNLKADSTSEDFAERDALHYHVYDLEPLLKLAILLKQATGVDYYSYEAPSGSSIRKSVDWLLPYLDGRKTHPEFVNSKVEFDRRRAQNGQAEYKAGTLFDPRNGAATLILAAYFDEDLLQLARHLLGTEEKYPNWQSVEVLLSRR